MSRHIWKAAKEKAGTAFVVASGLWAGGWLGWSLVVAIAAVEVFERALDARLIELQREGLALSDALTRKDSA